VLPPWVLDPDDLYGYVPLCTHCRVSRNRARKQAEKAARQRRMARAVDLWVNDQSATLDEWLAAVGQR
jgi:hypothetical protein